MNNIETIVPISLENLKIYFKDRETNFIIDYDNSTLKDEKFLVYISNLDLPCDVKLDPNKEEHLNLLKCYLQTKNIVNLPSLEILSLSLCLNYKFDRNEISKKFINENKELIEKWINVLESLILYNFYCIKSKKFENYVENFEKVNCSDIGLNFVNLLKYAEVTELFESVDKNKLKFYTDFFKEYMFKGKNLYYYWANENNPLFLLTWGIANSVKGQENVASI